MDTAVPKGGPGGHGETRNSVSIWRYADYNAVNAVVT